MYINKFCTACNIEIDKDTYKKWRSVCKDCPNKKKRKHTNRKNTHPITMKVFFNLWENISNEKNFIPKTR